MRLVNETINIKANPRNILHYRELGYDIEYGETINVNIVDIPHGSSIGIDVYCDICDRVQNISWSRYYKTYTKYGYYNCFGCRGHKTKQTNIEKYGSSTPLGNEDILRKVQKTNIEKYGSVCSLQGDVVKKKVKDTFLKKWGGGIGSHMNDPEIIDKIKQTHINNYGVDHPMKSDEVLSRMEETNIERYGVENVGKLPTIKNKIKNAHKSKYGTWFFNSDYFDRQSYNDGYYYSDDHLDNHFNNSRLEFKDIPISYRGKSMWELECGEGHRYIISRDHYNSRVGSNITTCLECVPLSDFNISLKELELFNLIKKIYQGDVISGYRELGFEIDIYIPDIKLGIEFNGLYWHSDKFKKKNYHKNKTITCIENGIELIHIWEDEWVNKMDIVMSIIKNKLSLINDRIYGRQTEIREVHYKIKNKFLDDNHIQGKCRSSINYGLYYKDELVSLMTFGKRNLNNIIEYELIRFCNKINTNVIGGASKLFKHFIKNNNDIEEIISYSDSSKYSGGLYEILGFNKVSDGVLNYYWTDASKRYHRFTFNKKKLVKEGYDPNMTENEIMKSRGFYKIWSVGHKKWVYKLSTIYFS